MVGDNLLHGGTLYVADDNVFKILGNCTDNMLNVEKEKEEHKMEKILEIYSDREAKKIEDEFDEKYKEIVENDTLVKRLNSINESYRRDLDEFYKDNIDDLVDVDDINISSNITINSEYLYKLCECIRKDRIRKHKELEEKIEEVQARIDLIKETSNDYKEIEKILTEYGIIGNKYRKCDVCECTKSTKRGRKSKTSTNA